MRGESVQDGKRGKGGTERDTHLFASGEGDELEQEERRKQERAHLLPKQGRQPAVTAVSPALPPPLTIPPVTILANVWKSRRGPMRGVASQPAAAVVYKTRGGAERRACREAGWGPRTLEMRGAVCSRMEAASDMLASTASTPASPCAAATACTA